MARPILSPTGTTEEPLSLATAAPEGFQCEDEFGICPCGQVIGGNGMSVQGHDTYTPSPNCFWCHGTGYRLTKRILRPTPQPDFSEQAALAQLKTKDLHLLMAAKTIEAAADMLERAGKAKDAAQTRQAAKAVRATVEGEG